MLRPRKATSLHADVHTCLFAIFDEKLKQIAEGNCAVLCCILKKKEEIEKAELIF